MRRGSIETADNVSNALLDAILADMPLKKGDRVGVLINGLGATPAMELYIIFRQVAKRLAELGVTIHRSYVGEYVTSLEMAGASITLIHLDDELARLIDAPARTPMFVQN
jgi:dihydroxyacetone kinase-like protein